MLNATTTGAILNAITGIDHPVQVSASWDENDPLVIRLTFLAEGYPDPVDWVFSRELLLEALASPEGVGDGDVVLTMKPDGMMNVMVDSPEGVAVIQMPSQMLAGLAASSVKIVEPGGLIEEAVYDAQFDDEIANLLSETL